MKPITRIAAAVFGLACASIAHSAFADSCQQGFVLAKVASQGRTGVPIAGSGTVFVQMQVNADGSHKFVKIQNSTNPGDNAAATQIASSSSYHPARCGTKAMTSFYDFKLHFNGKSLASSAASGGGGVGNSPVEALIREGKYGQAKSAAQIMLSKDPSDNQDRVLLGLAQFYDKDQAGAAQTFAQATSVPKGYVALASTALIAQSIALSKTDPATSLTFAQKAIALNDSGNSRFALGIAQIANKRTAEGVATLKAARDVLFREPTFPEKAKFGIDSHLMSAELELGDVDSAAAVGAEMKQLDPSSPYPGQALGAYYLNLGAQAQAAKKNDQALANYEQAAAQGDTQFAVTAYQRSIDVLLSDPKPDVAKAMELGQKAVTLAPDDALANYAAGEAQTLQWANSHKDSDKAQALVYLNKADSLAKAANNVGLSLSVEGFISRNVTSSGSAASPNP